MLADLVLCFSGSVCVCLFLCACVYSMAWSLTGTYACHVRYVYFKWVYLSVEVETSMNGGTELMSLL